MTTKTTGVIAAGFLAIGMVVGAAGTIVARDDAAPHMAGDMRGMSSMMSMMGGHTPMRPDASMWPDDHGSHHASPSPEATR